MELAPVTPDCGGFDRLLAESQAERHRMVLRLAENWRNGSNRFDRPGEIMLGAWDGDVLVGLCGRNVDPFDPSPRAGRVRHLYVVKDARRRGVGAALLGRMVDGAADYFDYLNTFAPAGAYAFYERQGFRLVAGVERVSHRVTLI